MALPRKATVQKRDWADEKEALEDLQRANATRTALETDGLKRLQEQLDQPRKKKSPGR